MTILRDDQLISEWHPGVKRVSRVNIAGDSDVVSITPNSSGVVGRFVHGTRELFGGDNSIVYSRYSSGHTQ